LSTAGLAEIGSPPCPGFDIGGFRLHTAHRVPRRPLRKGCARLRAVSGHSTTYLGGATHSCAGYRALEGGTRIHTVGRFLLVEPTANEFDGLDLEQFLPVWLVSENALEHRLRLARRAIELDDLLDFG
jgi:hypothetical protein